ncbi:MAG: hypothetical protein KDA83_05725 [Planctomycetales bacterium]|nr:hypothetical protein [Planctomycetales bacterium]
MKRTVVLGLVAVMTAVLAVPAMAQPGGGRGGRGGFGFGGPGGPGGGGSAMLVTNEAIQKELDLLDEQVADIEAAMEEMNENRPEFDFQALRDLPEDERTEKMEEFREKMQELSADMEKKIEGILLPEQMERLQQIQVQMQGIRALQSDRVAEELDLTSSQKEKIADAFDSFGEKMRERMQELRDQGGQGGPGGQGGRGGRGGFGALGEEMQKMNAELEEEVLDILSSSQRSKFDDMKGEEFDVSQLRRGPGGRGGAGGPGGPGGGGPGGRGGAGGPGGRGGAGGRGPGNGNNANDRA